MLKSCYFSSNFPGYHVAFEILDLRSSGCPPEFMNIPVPQGDPVFDPNATGKVQLPFRRGEWDEVSGQSPSNPRIQVWIIDPYLMCSLHCNRFSYRFHRWGG